MDKWQFEYGPQDDGRAQWRWIHLLNDGTRRISDRAFDSFRACEAHAVRHGYRDETSPRTLS